MAQRLTDLQPRELSLVRRGAVRRPFLFTKADEDEEVTIDAGTLALLAKEHGVDAEEFAKALAEAPEVDEEPILKAKYSADERQAMAKSGEARSDGSYPIRTAADVKDAVHDLNRPGSTDADKQHVIKRAKALDATDQLPDAWNVKKEEGMPVEGTGAVVPIKKSDGTWDLSGVPEEHRAGFEELIAKADQAETAVAERDELQKTANAALEKASATEDKLENAEYIAKAEQLDKLPADATTLGPDLRAIAKAEKDGHLPEGTAGRLDDLLKAANTAIETGDLYAELGVGGNVSKSGNEEFDAKVDEIRKADTSLTSHQAFAKAMKDHPDLYARATEEK